MVGGDQDKPSLAHGTETPERQTGEKRMIFKSKEQKKNCKVQRSWEVSCTDCRRGSSSGGSKGPA